MVPEKRTGSCGMMARRVRRSWSLILEMSTPSMVMLPERALRKRKSARERVDLPTGVSYLLDNEVLRLERNVYLLQSCR